MKLTPALIAAMREQPALAAPGGPDPTWKPTLHSPDQKWFYICVSLCAVISGVFVVLRMYTKLYIVRKLDVPDFLILLSFALVIAEIGVGRVTLDYGAGVHQWHIQYKHLFELLKWMNIAEILYGPSIFVVKMSILVQYLQMFAPNRTINGFVFWGSWLVILTSFTFYTIDTFLTIFACNPRKKIWNKFEQGGHCINYHAVILATGYFNIVSDLAILLLPVRSVWKLQIPLRKKINISLLFGTGLLACVASAMRIVETFLILHNETHADVSFHIAWMGLWSYAELALGVIVACSLSLPKLAQNTNWKLSTLFSGSSESSNSTWRFKKEHSKDSGSITVVKMGQTLSQTNLTRTSDAEDYQLSVFHSGPKSERV